MIGMGQVEVNLLTDRRYRQMLVRKLIVFRKTKSELHSSDGNGNGKSSQNV